MGGNNNSYLEQKEVVKMKERLVQMDMINWLAGWLKNDNTKIAYLLVMILGANLLDFFIGWVNAKFNPKIKFSSSKAIYGIARKIVMFMILVYFIPVAVLLPDPIGVASLYVLFIGYLWSEITSIVGHLKGGEDKDKVDLFSEFIKTIFQRKDGDK